MIFQGQAIKSKKKDMLGRPSICFIFFKSGFTLVELLVVIGMFLILTVTAIPIYSRLLVSSQLNEKAAQIVQALRLAREQSLARENSQRHGIYFDINSDTVDSFTVYQGSAYATRDPLYDQKVDLGGALSLEALGFVLTGSDVDINFSPGSGDPNNVGSIILHHSTSGSRQINLNSLGRANLE